MPAGAVADSDSVFSSDTDDEAAGAAKLQRRIDEGTEFKLEGNKLLQQGELSAARAAYKRALGAVWAPYKQRSNSGAVALGAAVDLNLALCHLRSEDWEEAKRCATRALEADPKNAKGLYRRGVAAARLGLLDAAEADLARAQALEPSADVRRELLDIRARLAATKGEGGGAVPKGFLKATSGSGGRDEKREKKAPADSLAAPSKATAEAAAAKPPAGDAAEEEEEEGEDLGDAEELGYVTCEQLEIGLQEIRRYLADLVGRPVLCSSEAARESLRKHLDEVESLLPRAREAVDRAVVDDENEATIAKPSKPPGEIMDLEALLECMAANLGDFRPYFALQARSDGEFDNLRICRDLGQLGAGGAVRTFDLELVRWGTAGRATAADFAEPLFPPTGRAPDRAAAEWQEEAFHRVFQKDASKYVAGSAWALLRILLERGVDLRLRGSKVVDVGLAHGLFFEGPVGIGPETPGKNDGAIAQRTRVDSLAICMGSDRRVVVVPSFASLGIVHKWLLLRIEGQEASNSADVAEVATDETVEVAYDLCAGALGLLSPPASSSGKRTLARFWNANEGDDRFLARRVRWGATAAQLAGPPSAAGWRGAHLQRAALEALIVGAASASSAAARELAVADAAALIAGSQPAAVADSSSAADAGFRETETLREATRRLRRNIDALGLRWAGAAGEFGTDGTCSETAAGQGKWDEVALEAAQRAAVEELLRRKLCAAGLAPLAARLPAA
eukprot:TRINITY_DN56551_c0_g1_i1.p1 TRINITY_DN56551_c0_g1~~TRINITY_DN56551_c0_g1_i1.p1  ORF type:complete len:736 (+),score=199.69 TRINITY_DN56551_c0_g1_i1:84-2291(+)